MNNKKEGFYTYEAAVLLPLFTFAVLVFLLIFRVLSFEWGLFSSVYEGSTHIALYGDSVIDLGEVTETGHSGDSEISPLTVYGATKAVMRRKGVSQKFVRSGKLGFTSFLRTEVNDRDIDVKVSYRMPLLAGRCFFGRRGYEMGTRVCVRRWNGYDPAEGENDDSVVYVTEHGQVYHESLSCTHIRLSIHTASVAGISRLRNTSGHIYHPCEKCGAAISGVCYYTDYGERKHSSLTCSKLKRTIRTMSREEAVHKYRPCSQCST